MKSAQTLFRTDGLLSLVLALLLTIPSVATAKSPDVERAFSERALEMIDERGSDRVNLIVTYRAKATGSDVDRVRGLGATKRRDLGLINGHAISVPAKAALKLIEHNPNIARVSVDERLESAYFTVGSSSVDSSW